MFISEINAAKELKKFLSNKKVWCASSTHNPEELIVAKTHKILNSLKSL